MMMRALVCYGTRPEKIKLEPVITTLRKRGASVETWFSGQSSDLVKGGNSSESWKSGLLKYGISDTLTQVHVDGFDVVIVQGDTATAFACGLAAYLAHVPVAHVEAGLRTYARNPYPEEAFRGMITRLAKWHFCPDKIAASNVAKELGKGVNSNSASPFYDYWGTEGIFITGNTIIDTLPLAPLRVLVTLHRRENWGKRIQEALNVLGAFQGKYPHSVEVYAIRHPNWDDAGVDTGLYGCNLIYLDPIDHDQIVKTLENYHDLVVTDSGGLQEEAAHFGIPCIVVREQTERVALLSTGAVQLVNPDKPEELRQALESELAKRTQYGNGHAGEKIAKILMEENNDL